VVSGDRTELLLLTLYLPCKYPLIPASFALAIESTNSFAAFSMHLSGKWQGASLVAGGAASASSLEPSVYRLKAVAKVVDGDTVDLDLDLGFSLTLRQRVRLYGIDALELRCKGPFEKAKGQEGQAFVAQCFQYPGQVLVGSTREEKVGRMLADCYREGAPSLCAELLLLRGLARRHTPPKARGG
jgi:micrococcal nuclease